jgi:hypothetical protein
MISCGIALAIAVAAIAFVDEGEVVALVTFDAQGRSFETDLWVVDVDGGTYVRAAHPGADWLDRLRRRPEVHLLRDGGMLTLRAVPAEEQAVREAVNAAMRRKYAWVDRALVLLRDHSRAVPVRLDPLAKETR